MIDPITKQKVTVDELRHDIELIKRHIEAAPDEETEECYRETLYKWKRKLAHALGASAPRGE